MNIIHDDVIKWKHFPRHWPICVGNSPVPGEFPAQIGQWRGTLMFSLICARINCWVNNPEAGDLRPHRTHYDVIAMHYPIFKAHKVQCVNCYQILFMLPFQSQQKHMDQKRICYLNDVKATDVYCSHNLKCVMKCLIPFPYVNGCSLQMAKYIHHPALYNNAITYRYSVYKSGPDSLCRYTYVLQSTGSTFLFIQGRGRRGGGGIKFRGL